MKIKTIDARGLTCPLPVINAKKAAEEERASAKETDDKLLKEMEEAGVQVNEVADKQQFRDAVKPIHEAFAADVNKELLDKINEKIAEIQ